MNACDFAVLGMGVSTSLGWWMCMRQRKQEYVDQLPLGRFVQAEDVAALVAFLASEEGKNITGQALDVSAGWGI